MKLSFIHATQIAEHKHKHKQAEKINLNFYICQNHLLQALLFKTILPNKGKAAYLDSNFIYTFQWVILSSVFGRKLKDMNEIDMKLNSTDLEQ